MKEEKFVEVKCIGEGWEAEYERKRVSAEEAVKVVQSGDRVIVPWFNGTLLSEALVERKNELSNVTIHASWPQETHLGMFLEEDVEDAFSSTVEIFIGDYARTAPVGSDSKKLQYLPVLFSSMFKVFDERPEECPYTIDVLMAVVSPPDKDGFCSFGSGLWTKRSYAKRARHVIVQTMLFIMIFVDHSEDYEGSLTLFPGRLQILQGNLRRFRPGNTRAADEQRDKNQEIPKLHVCNPDGDSYRTGKNPFCFRYPIYRESSTEVPGTTRFRCPVFIKVTRGAAL